MKIKHIAIFLIFPLIVSCQAISTGMAVNAGSKACGESKSKQKFPKDGSKKYIDISFGIKDSNRTIPFKKNITCEYQGSLCTSGNWRQIWYGNRKLKNTVVELSNNNKLSFNEHTQCVRLGGYAQKCASNNCKLADEFGILVLFSEKYTQIRKSQIDSGKLKKREGKYFIFPEREFMSFSRLKDVGVTIESLKINLSN